MIKIICVGKIKESFYREAVAEYMKRLSKYHKVVIQEVMDSNIKDESALILKLLQPKDYIITLEILGEEFTSLELAECLDKTFLTNSNIVFVIGGSDGLSDEVKKRAQLHLSFSKLTFPHQMFRVILLEQIYRSFKIMHHESYHK